MQLKPRSSRTIALLTGAVIAATTLFQPSPAQAADKSKNLKYGAIGLGVLGAYLLTKGKTVGGAAAVAGGLYAYKKGRNAQKDDCDPRDRPRDGHDHGNGGYNNGSYGNGGYGNGGYNDGGYNNSGYGNGGYGNGGYGSGGYSTGGYGSYDPQYRSNADYRDNRGGKNDDYRDDRRNDRKSDGRRDDRNDRNDNRSGYDLSPYLR